MKKINLICLLPLCILGGCSVESGVVSSITSIDLSTYYTITFVADDGETVLATTQTKENEIPVYPYETPTKDMTKSTVYTFAGWSPELVAATSNATYTATFTETTRQYLVEWLDYDYTVCDYAYVNYGEKPVVTDKVTQTWEDDFYVYTFAAWGASIKKVTKDLTYVPTYSKVAK